MLSVKDLFDVEAKVSFEVEGQTIHFYFRHATTEEETDYRRKVSRQRLRENGTFETSDSALNAPLQFFRKLCKKITMQNGAEAVEVPLEEQQFIPDQVKLDALGSFRGRVRRKDDEALRD